MIIDITNIELTPGNCGRDCLGNGEHIDNNGNLIECCCDECSYMLCCLDDYDMKLCKTCDDFKCPRNKNKSR